MKARGEHRKDGKLANPPRIAVPSGRGASDYRPGVFAKKYLEQHGQGCAADIFRALSDELERMNKERIELGEKPFRRPTYNSFAKYWHWFKIMNLVEPTRRREPAIYSFLEPRVFYRLSDKGKAEEEAWKDPVRAAHPEFR